MSPEAQRIAIAEACGWVYDKGEAPTYGGNYTKARWFNQRLGEQFFTDWTAKRATGLPDYLNDLNAMHEAEECLKDKIDEGVYEERIEMEMGTRGRAAFSTAKQRASAMVKTFNLWKE